MKDTKTLINELGHLCGETTGGTFTITRLRDTQWQVTFANSGKIQPLKDKDIDIVLQKAINEVKEKRVALEVETKYTLFS